MPPLGNRAFSSSKPLGFSGSSCIAITAPLLVMVKSKGQKIIAGLIVGIFLLCIAIAAHGIASYEPRERILLFTSKLIDYDANINRYRTYLTFENGEVIYDYFEVEHLNLGHMYEVWKHPDLEEYWLVEVC